MGRVSARLLGASHAEHMSFAFLLRSALERELTQDGWKVSGFTHLEHELGAHVSFIFHCPCGNDIRENMLVRAHTYSHGDAWLEAVMIDGYVRRMKQELKSHLDGDNPSMRIKDIARVAHEVNRAYCRSIGDDSQKPWSEAAEWQRRSAMSGVIHIADNRNAGPDTLHRKWLEEKEREGWTYGPEKDEGAKTHPCCVPFDQLPEEQQTKDALFIAVARTLLEIGDED